MSDIYKDISIDGITAVAARNGMTVTQLKRDLAYQAGWASGQNYVDPRAIGSKEQLLASLRGDNGKPEQVRALAFEAGYGEGMLRELER